MFVFQHILNFHYFPLPVLYRNYIANKGIKGFDFVFLLPLIAEIGKRIKKSYLGKSGSQACIRVSLSRCKRHFVHQTSQRCTLSAGFLPSSMWGQHVSPGVVHGTTYNTSSGMCCILVIVVSRSCYDWCYYFTLLERFWCRFLFGFNQLLPITQQFLFDGNGHISALAYVHARYLGSC
jgi:hypothetical protein